MGLNYQRAEDDELIRGCQRSDPAAQHRLYQTYAPKMYTLCCRYLKDTMLAEDALVTAFTRILDRFNQYKGQGTLEGWIKTIVVREALVTLRRNQHLRFRDDLDTIEAGAVAQPPSNTIETAELMTMISELPPGYRTVFNMYAIDGYTHKEIAEHLGISENTSKSQLSRARALLQQRLAVLESPLIKTRS